MKRSASRLSERDKDLYTILACLLLICPYVLLVYSDTRSQIQFTDNMLNRIENRIATRAALPEPPKESASDLAEQLAEIKQIERDAVARAEAREQSFATLRSVDEVKGLRLEITRLAEQTGVSVNRFGELRESDSEDSISLLMEQAKNRFERPIMELEVRSDFPRLITFIDGLRNLSKTVAIVRFDVEAPEFDQDPNALIRKPLLTAKLDVAL